MRPCSSGISITCRVPFVDKLATASVASPVHQPGSSDAHHPPSKQISNENEGHAKIGPDWVEGYGFQFWRCRHNAYRADGAGGQFIVIMPDQDVVVAITADSDNMQAELDAIWDRLLPAFQAKSLPENVDAQDALKETVANLVAHPKQKND